MKLRLLILLSILLVAFFLRFYQLESVPPSLNWDEVSHGYNAYSILKTGHDEWGELLPLGNFRAYGDYPLPLNLYLTIPFILLLGLNDIAIRMPSVIFGSLLTVVIFYLVRIITKNEKISFLASLLVAISPWWVMTNRQVIQSTPAVFFLTLGITIFLYNIEKINWKIILGALFLGLSAYAYHNTRIIAPLIALSLLFIYRTNLLKNKKVLSLIIGVFLVFFIPLIPILAFGGGSARATWVGILDQGAINRIDENRGDSNLPDPLKRLIYNKVLYFAGTAAYNYLGYFSPTYLALEGGTQYQFSVPHFGVIYPVELPFFYFGLIYLLMRIKKLNKIDQLLLIWLFLAPIPAAITRDPYQVVRSTIMIPVVYILIAYGFGLVFKYLDHKKFYKVSLVSIFLILLTVFFLRYNYNFYNLYPKQYSQAWQYGYKQAILYIQENQDKYQTIAMTKNYGEPHEYLLFYLKYDPLSYQTDPNLIRYERSDWFWVDGFSKYKFINDWEIKTALKDSKNILLITTPGNYPENAHLLKTINFLDNTPAFDIVEM